MLNEREPKKRRGRPPKRPTTEKPPSTWEDRLVLNPGDALRQSDFSTTGNLAQNDIENYDVIDAQGQTVGTVTYTALTSLKPPFPTRHSLVQRDSNGNVILERRW